MDDVELFNYLQDERTDLTLKLNKVERDIANMQKDPYRIEPMFRKLKETQKEFKLKLDVVTDLLKEGISLDIGDKLRKKSIYYSDKVKDLDYKIRIAYVRQFSNPNWKKDVQKLEEERSNAQFKLETVKRYFK